MNESNDISALLTDVRKSYRLLHDYQQLILDSLKYIGTQLDIPYRGGWSLFSNPQPRNGKGHFENWAWDWLGMYEYEFRFAYTHDNSRKIKIKENEWVSLSVILINDSGYFEASDESPSESETTKFKDAAHSKTRVAFLMAQGEWNPLAPLKDREVMKKLLQSVDHSLPPSLTKAGIHGFICDVSEILTQESTDKIIKDITKSAEENNIPILLKGHKQSEQES